MPLWQSILLVLVPIAGTGIVGWLQARGTRMSALVDQMQEERASVRDERDQLRRENRRLLNYVSVLVAWINAGNGPPPPPWPEDLTT